MARLYAELLPANMFQPLATEFAYLALTSGYIDASDLLNIKGHMVKSICGSHLKLTNEPLKEVEQLTKHFRDRRVENNNDALSHNSQTLANGLSLPNDAWKVIQLMVVMDTNSGLSEFVQQVLPTDMYINALFASMIGLDEVEVINISLALSGTGLFPERCLHLIDLVGLPRGIINGLIGEKTDSYTTLIAPLIQLQPRSQLTFKDIFHLDMDALVEFLTVAVNHSLVGVNILLYGEAGTGKSELSRLFADTMDAALIAIKPLGSNINQHTPDYESTTGSASLRLQHHRLIQNVVSHDEKTVLVVDEAEDIFCEGLFTRGNSNRRLGKEVLHDILETNAVPTIWITNHVDALPPSCIRRFSFVKHIHVPDNRVMESVINKTTKGLRLSPTFKVMLAAKSQITPAHVSTATFICQTLGYVGKQAEATMVDMIDETLLACGIEEHKAQYKPQLDFSTELLNIKGGNSAIEKIRRAVNTNGDIRTLLTGPSGTGKTAVVNHLAKQANKELMTVRCSDVLDKYVGGSEKNIARLFKEADERGAILFFDEIDSLLQDRGGMTQSFEVQQVNELLTQIECFNQPFFAATNFSTRLDSAVMRRFDFKLHFEYLTSPQVLMLYNRLLGKSDFSKNIRDKLLTLKSLTPGDFAIIVRRLKISNTKASHTQCLAILTQENNRKQQPKAIGFIN
ncbi:AAA family ATPase [Colwellia sp. 20A7]|uniref:AAA family ATPase n=1 Tax=Colwellia sp. 20A7 TaxID=2689569 RepID=UPI001F2055A1|nr:AAA family ATPase [Colwellia sp. 20A7]